MWPKFLGLLLGLCLVLLDNFGPRARSGIDRLKPKLAVREEPGRIVLTWSGPVAEPMRDDIAAAIDKLNADPRRIVIALNSPGGSVEHGRKVAEVIRDASRLHGIDTLVEEGGVCASMCVPIFLTGAERLAGPKARFMFHQATVSLPEDEGQAKAKDKPKAKDKTDEALLSRLRGALETMATDDLFERDIATQGVDPGWLARIRKKIVGHDVWITAEQLVEEKSGVVDKLVRRAAM